MSYKEVEEEALASNGSPGLKGFIHHCQSGCEGLPVYLLIEVHITHSYRGPSPFKLRADYNG
eukprot:3952267-Amphidinium_carterae.1